MGLVEYSTSHLFSFLNASVSKYIKLKGKDKSTQWAGILLLQDFKMLEGSVFIA